MLPSNPISMHLYDIILFTHVYLKSRDCNLFVYYIRMHGGDLLELIRKRKSFHEKEARRLFSQILSAIAFLHANGIVHRDIKVIILLFSYP